MAAQEVARWMRAAFCPLLLELHCLLDQHHLRHDEDVFLQAAQLFSLQQEAAENEHHQLGPNCWVTVVRILTQEPLLVAPPQHACVLGLAAKGGMTPCPCFWCLAVRI
jgi:hypothetical protein